MNLKSLKSKAVAVVLAGAVGVSGCGWWNSGGSQQAQNDGLNLASCVMEAAFTGNLTLQGLAASCVGVGVSDLLAAIDSLVTYYTSFLSPDGGAGVAGAVVTAASVYCGDPAKKPYSWAPVCVEAKVVDNLKSLKSNVLAARAGK